MTHSSRRVWGPVAVALALLVGACASPRHQAPVEARAPTAPAPVAAPMTNGTVEARPVSPGQAAPLPGAENAGKPGYYTVKPGDTMIRIGLETGQNWRDIARWNNLENPNVIEVGQVLRVIAPTEVTAARAPAAATAQAAATSPSTTTAQGGTPAQGGAVTQPVGATAAPAVVATAPATTTAPASRDPDEDIVWTWPASGPVASPFDDARNKGLAILGKAGDPVLAAADGRVVYSGAGLRGYGNLVIVKHNNTYLSAYAHNQSLLVKEDQIVRRGQKIAEMGSTDAERVQLHFEIRRQGRPIDPSKLLPPR